MKDERLRMEIQDVDRGRHQPGVERSSQHGLCQGALGLLCNAEGTPRPKLVRARLHHRDEGLTGPLSSRSAKYRWGVCGHLELSLL